MRRKKTPRRNVFDPRITPLIRHKSAIRKTDIMDKYNECAGKQACDPECVDRKTQHERPVAGFPERITSSTPAFFRNNPFGA
jgi:hypothetical protein